MAVACHRGIATRPQPSRSTQTRRSFPGHPTACECDPRRRGWSAAARADRLGLSVARSTAFHHPPALDGSSCGTPAGSLSSARGRDFGLRDFQRRILARQVIWTGSRFLRTGRVSRVLRRGAAAGRQRFDRGAAARAAGRFRNFCGLGDCNWKRGAHSPVREATVDLSASGICSRGGGPILPSTGAGPRSSSCFCSRAHFTSISYEDWSCSHSRSCGPPEASLLPYRWCW